MAAVTSESLTWPAHNVAAYCPPFLPEETKDILSSPPRSGPYVPGNALTTASILPTHSLDSLGWTREEALETYHRLRVFAEDWDAPGMELYDRL